MKKTKQYLIVKVKIETLHTGLIIAGLTIMFKHSSTNGNGTVSLYGVVLFL